MSPAFDIAAMDGFAVHSGDVYPLKYLAAYMLAIKNQE